MTPDELEEWQSKFQQTLEANPRKRNEHADFVTSALGTMQAFHNRLVPHSEKVVTHTVKMESQPVKVNEDPEAQGTPVPGPVDVEDAPALVPRNTSDLSSGGVSDEESGHNSRHTRKSRNTKTSQHSRVSRIAPSKGRQSVASSRRRAKLEPDALDGNHVPRRALSEHPKVNAKINKPLVQVVCDSDGTKQGLTRVLAKTIEDSKFKFADQVSSIGGSEHFMDNAQLGMHQHQLNRNQLAQFALQPPMKREVLSSKLKWDGDQAAFREHKNVLQGHCRQAGMGHIFNQELATRAQKVATTQQAISSSTGTSVLGNLQRTRKLCLVQ